MLTCRWVEDEAGVEELHGARERVPHDIHCDPEQEPAPALHRLHAYRRMPATAIAAACEHGQPVLYAVVTDLGECRWLVLCASIDACREAAPELARFIARERGRCFGNVADPRVRALFEHPQITQHGTRLDWVG